MDGLTNAAFAAAAVLLMQSLIVLASVALGGWLVFRTKRDSHERLFFERKREAESLSYLDPLEKTENLTSQHDVFDAAEKMHKRLTARAKAALRDGGDIDG